MKNLTVAAAQDAIRANNFKDTAFTCDDGTIVTVVPCFYVDEPKSFDDIDYYLVYGGLPWMGDDKLEKVINEINNYSKLVAESDAEKAKLRAYFDDHQKNGWSDESWSWYSDWHKDVYGYRPHGFVCGVYVRPY